MSAVRRCHHGIPLFSEETGCIRCSEERWSRPMPPPDPHTGTTAEETVRAIRDLIPMDYLKARDVPGATGPTAKLDLVGAVRDYSAARWRLIDRLKKAEAERDALLTAMQALNECILGRAESNASGNPEWEYVSSRINAARAALRLALPQGDGGRDE